MQRKVEERTRSNKLWKKVMVTWHYITLAPDAPIIMIDTIVTPCDFQIRFNSCFSSWYFSFFFLIVFHLDVKWIITIIFYLLIYFLC